MMSPLPMAMALFSAPRARPLRRWGLPLSVMSSLALVGCSSAGPLPSVLYVSIGTNADQTIDAQLLQDIRDRLSILEGGFRQIVPSVRFQFSLYPEARIPEVMRRRTRAALGPDLMLLNGDTAVRMYKAGLVDVFPTTAEERKRFNPQEVARLQVPGGGLAGLPLLEQTQVACFNRSRLQEAPETLNELLTVSASGHPMGLSVDLDNVFWTAGSLGAVQGINRAVTGGPLSPEERQGIVRWLAWLQNASAQQRITFFANQASTVQEFAAGRLDWIPCQSVTVPRLRKQLGRSLGVTNLPRGDAGEPSPINRLRVLTLGRSSSRAGRHQALAFSRFATNPLSQRNLTLGSQTVLPANRFVKVPVQSSQTLEAMVRSSEQGRQLDTLFQMLAANDTRLPKVQVLLNGLVFGENSPAATADALIHLLQSQR